MFIYFWLIRQLILINFICTAIWRKLHHVHWFLHELKPVYTINSCALYHECLVWILLSLYLYYSSPDYCLILIHISNAASTSVDPTFFPSYIIVFSPILIPCLNYIPPKACTQKHFALTSIINVHIPFGFVE
jgi:hypothetical protein